MCNGKRIENNSFLFLKGFTGGECGTAVTMKQTILLSWMGRVTWGPTDHVAHLHKRRKQAVGVMLRVRLRLNLRGASE